MTDRYQALANSPLAGAAVKRLGLPVPPRLERHEPGRPLVAAPVVVGSARGGRLLEPAVEIIRSAGARVETDPGVDRDGAGGGPAALVFDASDIDSSERLRALYDFFATAIRSMRPSGRAIVLAAVAEELDEPRAATAQRAIEGFVRSVGKEVGARGSTAQPVRVG